MSNGGERGYKEEVFFGRGILQRFGTCFSNNILIFALNPICDVYHQFFIWKKIHMAGR